MTVALFDTAHIAAIADAIRDRCDIIDTMTVQEMPAYIMTLAQLQTEREVWLEKPTTAPAALGMDTGITADLYDRIVVTIKTQEGQMACPFNAFTNTSQRIGVSLLGASNKVQLYWGTWSNTSLQPSTDQIDVTQELTYTAHAGGFTFTQAGKSGWSNAGTINGAAGNAINSTYKLFTYGGNANMCRGFFREAKIYRRTSTSGDGTLTYDLVPMVNKYGEVYIFDKVSQTKLLDVPEGFVTHEIE